MKILLTFQALVIALLVTVVLELGLIAMKLPTPTARAAASEPLPVYIVNGPLGLFQWAKVSSGTLEMQINGGTPLQAWPVDVRIVK